MTAITQEKKSYLTVSELTHLIKQKLEREFSFIQIQGEISNCKVQSSGHIYFSLKDQNAQISCVMFRGSAANLKSLPKEGDQVLIRGEINVYPPRGYYQIIVKELKPLGVGELLLQFQQLKEKLASLGWFDKEKKKPLPKFPKTIGVITSPTGAVIQDIIHVLTRRFGNFHLILNPVKVQGPGAAQEIAQAVDDCNRYQLADVLIVGRGGGSFEDLFCFSEEIVVKAIFASKIPIISAVGHETDYSIADFVADVRAPTPSAAAEIALGEKGQILDYLKKTTSHLSQILTHKIVHLKEKLYRIASHPIMADPYVLLGMRLQKLDEVKNSLDKTVLYQLQEKRNRIEGWRRELRATSPQQMILHHKNYLLRTNQQIDLLIAHRLQEKKKALKNVIQILEAIDPKKLLQKGYSILFSEKTGSVISRASDLRQENRVKARLSDGVGTLQVIEVENEK